MTVLSKNWPDKIRSDRDTKTLYTKSDFQHHNISGYIIANNRVGKKVPLEHLLLIASQIHIFQWMRLTWNPFVSYKLICCLTFLSPLVILCATTIRCVLCASMITETATTHAGWRTTLSGTKKRPAFNKQGSHTYLPMNFHTFSKAFP